MRHYLLFAILIIVTACQKKEFAINPSDYLSETEQQDFKYNIVRYVERLPGKATQETKFDTIYDAQYRQMANKMDLVYYYEKDDQVYFAISKIAPSLKVKKTLTAGRLKFGNDKQIAEFEESFRTWKMEEPELLTKSKMLFEKYIEGEDLAPYYTDNSNGDFYIEFPDNYTVYDKQSRTWLSKPRNGK